MTICSIFRRLVANVAAAQTEPLSKVKQELSRQAAELREQLRLDAMARYAKRLARKEANIAAPRPVYEGPRNVRYWMTRRRSGMRK
ncbi:hypothetical protein BBBOND_0104280 [Babesia bigemina]|uniref:Uncharacterized protein n=1 Tax=Babesia bigemina TaxID=5866 RepID=A0A061D572_BABBI|nr:hypothetical protein BBBOND_0104280 [Babesia bigemina]CDR94119.1 hypothetical protein BBBOND_0104280 [Babesia bigemina]|eukprot:XP_012766305.1 hypothetical protein BBBOND_0104280 [Babesia bigemina]